MSIVTVRGADFRVEELVSGGIVIQNLDTGKTGFFDSLKKEYARDVIDNDLTVPPWMSLSGMEVMSRVYSVSGKGYVVADYCDAVISQNLDLRNALVRAWEGGGGDRSSKVQSHHVAEFIVTTDGLGGVFLERGTVRHQVTLEDDGDPEVLAELTCDLFDKLNDSFQLD